jgi:cytochrome c-type biogenesis protein CcmH
MVKMDDPVVLSLGARLRCPVCQGMPIGESPAPMAQDMMREVRRLRVEEGQSEEQIAAHFTERYGTWVLLDPPKQGVGLLVWMLPPAALMIGLGAALGSVAHKRAVAAAHQQPGSVAGAGGPVPPAQQDEALLAEVRRQVEN